MGLVCISATVLTLLANFLYMLRGWKDPSVYFDWASNILRFTTSQIWYAIGMNNNASLSALPNGLALVTLVSNFGTFALYGLTNIVAIVAFREHHEFNGLKHMVIPVFGAIANFGCMAFYIIGPIEGLGSVKEPLMAVGISVIWGIYGAIYFVRNSKKKGKETILVTKPA